MSFIIIRTLTLIQSFTNLPSLRQLSVLMTNHGLDVLLSSLQTYLQLTVIWVRVAEQSYHNRNKTKQNKAALHSFISLQAKLHCRNKTTNETEKHVR